MHASTRLFTLAALYQTGYTVGENRAVRRTQKAARPGVHGILHKTAARIKGPGSEVCCRARADLKMTYESSVFMEALSCSVISSASLLVGAFAV